MIAKSSISFILMVGPFLVLGACSDVPSMKQDTPSPPNHCSEDRCSVATYPYTGRELDLIFLIDTSPSMADEQVILQANFPGLVRVLRDISGGLPNLHMGTITPDLGTYPYNLPGCERPGGDRGRYMKGPSNTCSNPVGQTYVVDVEPRGCTISKDIVVGQTTTCPNHDCTQANCDVAAFAGLDGVATEPAGLQFAVDEHGCPRCRNYSGQSLEQVFSCMATLGTSGCGLEQQLEAVKLAVTDRTDDNAGFLRSSAYLAVFIISDEDDCSTQRVELFDPRGDINSPLGSLTSFRCTEFGVVCDEPWQRAMPEGPMTYTNCRPREANDPANLLHPISVYTNTLSQLKDANMILVGAIAGPYEGSLTVGPDDHGNPQLQPTCGLATDGAMPAVRLLAFVESMLQREEDRYWAFTPICAEDFSRALYGLGTRIRSKLEVQCLAAPLCGCPDPAFAEPRRASTTTPLQALTLLNHQFSLDMAQRFASRLEQEAADTPGRIRRAFQLSASRDPTERELEAGVKLVEAHGLTALCRALINSNEFIHLN